MTLSVIRYVYITHDIYQQLSITHDIYLSLSVTRDIYHLLFLGMILMPPLQKITQDDILRLSPRCRRGGINREEAF